ncbi:hypothetical protein CUN91_00165 [Candidatus Carsonella ruddii]|uniref:Uncharacterized protein n=1 Tax=Carsonella ruddii TaxID=114186 RepID=A0A2K8K8L9_CARRU|nr:hypothetical protein [Candidatus Carsonella ruddii]ATX33371.1 hypothetical protein CUN91_00165 [Candidatus Carsonella ruddii]
MKFFKKNNNITVSYLVNNKISIFFGKIIKIKKFTFNVEKKIQGIKLNKIFFIKNPNLISLKNI